VFEGAYDSTKAMVSNFSSVNQIVRFGRNE
jgi:hypothetical protein